MGKNNYLQQDEETGYKFDARLRYVENLINAHFIVLQMQSRRKTSGFHDPREEEEWQSAFYNLYSMLKLHDDNLNEPNFNNLPKEYVEKLIFHEEIKNLTANKLQKKSIEEQIDEDYQ